MATASAVLGLVGTIGSVTPPPYGLAIMAVAGVATAVLGLFMDTGPSELEIIGGLIDDQTKQIAGMNPSYIYSWFLKPLSVLHSRFPTKKS